MLNLISSPIRFRSDRRSRGLARSAGFTVMELAVSMLVLVVVLLGMLSLFDFSNRLSHVQTNVADMQQALRIAQQDAVRRAVRSCGMAVGVELSTITCPAAGLPAFMVSEKEPGREELTW